jgi:hypothetical protein
MVVKLQHATITHSTMMCPLNGIWGVRGYPKTRASFLTSGLVSLHLGHLVVDAGVMFRCDDQYTPLARDKLYAGRFFAQIKL